MKEVNAYKILRSVDNLLRGLGDLLVGVAVGIVDGGLSDLPTGIADGDSGAVERTRRDQHLSQSFLKAPRER